jgi:hypothetical protein
MKKTGEYMFVNWVVFYMVYLVILNSADSVTVDERDPIVCDGK